jgi:hypothetical protein
MAASSSSAGIPKAIGSCSNLPSYNHAAHDLLEGEKLPHSPLISTKLYNIWWEKTGVSQTSLLKP